MSITARWFLIVILVSAILAACEPPSSPGDSVQDGTVSSPNKENTDSSSGQDEMPVDYLVSVLGLESGAEYRFQLLDVNGNVVLDENLVLNPDGKGILLPASILAEGGAKLVALNNDGEQVLEKDMVFVYVSGDSEEVSIDGQMFNLSQFDGAPIIRSAEIEDGARFLIVEPEQIPGAQE